MAFFSLADIPVKYRCDIDVTYSAVRVVGKHRSRAAAQRAADEYLVRMYQSLPPDTAARAAVLVIDGRELAQCATPVRRAVSGFLNVQKAKRRQGGR